MKQEGRRINFVVVFILLMLGMVFYYRFANNDSQRKNYTKEKFIADMEAGNISDVEIQLNSETPTGTVYVRLKTGAEKILYVTDIAEMEATIRSYDFDPVVHDVKRQSWFLTTLVPMLIIIVVGIFLFMMITAQNAAMSAGNSKMANFGRNRAKMITDGEITFDKVAGLREEKEDLEEIVDFLKQPSKYNNMGARIPKGVLLEGRPGTGKTLLAKAVAGEPASDMRARWQGPSAPG